MRNLGTKNIVLILCCFGSLLFDSWQFQKQLMTKSETRLGFKLLGKHWYIKSKVSSSKQKSREKKETYLFHCHTSIIPILKLRNNAIQYNTIIKIINGIHKVIQLIAMKLLKILRSNISLKWFVTFLLDRFSYIYVNTNIFTYVYISFYERMSKCSKMPYISLNGNCSLSFLS